MDVSDGKTVPRRGEESEENGEEQDHGDVGETSRLTGPQDNQSPEITRMDKKFELMMNFMVKNSENMKEDLKRVSEDMKKMDEGLKENIRENIQGIEGNMATKEDLREIKGNMATKEDLREIKGNMATKEEMARMEKRVSEGMKEMRKEFEQSKSEFVKFLIASISISYGIIFLIYVDLNTYTIENGLWTTILYISTWHLTWPWSKNICESIEDYRYDLFKFMISLAVVCLFIGIVLPGQIIFYGVFGGIFCNIITIQLRFVATEKFNTDPKIFEGNIQSARALSLLIMPHLLLLIVDNYTMVEVKFLLAAFLLNTIPAVLIITPPSRFVFKISEVSRYHTLTAFSTQMREMRDFTGSANTSGIIYNESICTESEENEGEINKDLLPLSVQMNTENAVISDDAVQTVPLTQLNIQNYFSKAGVSILPEIPEEMSSDLDLIDSKRLSKISTQLEQLNQTDRRDSIKEIFNINDLISINNSGCQETIENIEFITNYKENDNRFVAEIKSIKHVSCCHCPSYRLFLWRRRLRSVKDFFTDNFVRPLLRSLKVFYFYLALLSKTSLMLVSTIYITLGPYLALEKNKDFKVEDTTFFLSYIAFAWCLFLMLLPLVMTLSRHKIRMAFIIGLGVAALSMLLLTKYILSNDFVILSCLLFGFGYGITSYTEAILYRAYIGAMRWNQIQGTLETLSAILIVLIYYVLYRLKLDIEYLLPLIGFVTYLSNAVLWIVIPVLVSLITIVKNRYKNDDEQDFT